MRLPKKLEKKRLNSPVRDKKSPKKTEKPRKRRNNPTRDRKRPQKIERAWENRPKINWENREFQNQLQFD